MDRHDLLGNSWHNHSSSQYSNLFGFPSNPEPALDRIRLSCAALHRFWVLWDGSCEWFRRLLRIIVHLTSGGCISISFHVNYEEEEEEESLRTVFCSIVRSDFESVCGRICRPWPDLQLAHQLGWHLCASCPKLRKTYKTVSFLGSHHITHICEQVTSTISFHCLTSEVWSAPMQLLLTKYWFVTSLQRTKELTLATVPYCTEASVVGCLEKIVHPKAWRKFIPPQVR